jgi:hypothetical protein
MVRFIFFNTIWQVVVLLTLLFKGDDIFGVPQTFTGEEWTYEKGVHGTIFFSTFVFLQVFNFFNARVLEVNETNVLRNLTNNYLFLAIVAAVFVVQIGLIQVGGKAFHLAPLTAQQLVITILLGMTQMVWQAIYKNVIPESCLNSLAPFHIEPQPEDFDVDSKIIKLLKRPSTYLRGSHKKIAADFL